MPDDAPSSISAPVSKRLNAKASINGYGAFDPYFGWRLGEGDWDLSVFATNLFDTDEVNNYLPEWRTRVGGLGAG